MTRSDGARVLAQLLGSLSRPRSLGHERSQGAQPDVASRVDVRSRAFTSFPWLANMGTSWETEKLPAKLIIPEFKAFEDRKYGMSWARKKRGKGAPRPVVFLIMSKSFENTGAVEKATTRP